MNKKELKSLIAYTVENGGATLAPNGKIVSFPIGYQVAEKQHEKIISLEKGLPLETLNAYLLTAKKARGFVGLWIEDNKLYLDISLHILNKGIALSMGRKEKQLSIYEWESGLCLAC